jgi:hypothetical protein
VLLGSVIYKCDNNTGMYRYQYDMGTGTGKG